MKKLLGKMIFFGLTFFLTNAVQAGPVEGNIDTLKVDDNSYIYFSLKDGGSAENSCSSDSFIVFPTLTRFNEIYDLLLLAKSNNLRVVTGISGCQDNGTFGNIIAITVK